MAIILTETFSGAYTITGYGGGAVTGFDHPDTVWNDCAWGVNPVIGNTYPCPHGAENSIMFAIDCGHIDATWIGAYDLREWYCRWYMRLGTATVFDCTYDSVQWAKLNRFYSTTWSWNFIQDAQYYDNTTTGGQYLLQEVPTGVTLFSATGWTAAKWYYNELHIVLNTPGALDGAWEFRWRNVTDDLALESRSNSGVNLVNNLTETLGTLRIGGNYGTYNPTTNGRVRYANVALADSGWIGEASETPAQTPPTGVLELSAR